LEIQTLKEVNQKLQKRNNVLTQVIKGHMADIVEQLAQFKKEVKKKDTQREQLVSMYKQNPSLRSSNKKLS